VIVGGPTVVTTVEISVAGDSAALCEPCKPYAIG
jgi:hypothetical protein